MILGRIAREEHQVRGRPGYEGAQLRHAKGCRGGDHRRLERLLRREPGFHQQMKLFVEGGAGDDPRSAAVGPRVDPDAGFVHPADHGLHLGKRVVEPSPPALRQAADGREAARWMPETARVPGRQERQLPTREESLGISRDQKLRLRRQGRRYRHVLPQRFADPLTHVHGVHVLEAAPP